MNEVIINKKGLLFWQSPAFDDHKALIHGFSCRKGGVSKGSFAQLNLGYKGGDDPRKVEKNRSLFYQSLGVKEKQVITLKQVHGCKVHDLNADNFKLKCNLEGDALVTRNCDFALGVMAADCTALFFFDPDNLAIGLAHAGWKGTAEGISLRVLEKMNKLYGTKEHRLKVAISPSIGDCCYQVKDDVLTVFENYGCLPEFVWQKRNNDYYLNLKEINRFQLLQAGVNCEHIYVSNYCTHCHQDLFYSYRRDGRETGGMMALLALNENSDGLK